MNRPDPFYVVRDEVIKSLTQAKAEYEAWKHEVMIKSVNVKAVETALKQTIRNIDWDLEDLQESVFTVEKNPQNFLISADDLQSRQIFLHDAKRIIRGVRDQIADPGQVTQSINFDIQSNATANGRPLKEPSQNTLTSYHRPGSARIIGVTEQLKSRGGIGDDLNSGLLADQQMLMKDQDVHLEQLGDSISRLKDMSHRIGGELGDQVGLLDDFGEEMTHTDSKINHVMKRATRLLHLDSSRSQWWTIGVLLSFLLVILILLGVL